MRTFTDMAKLPILQSYLNISNILDGRERRRLAVGIAPFNVDPLQNTAITSGTKEKPTTVP